MAGDINAHSPIWNFYYHRRQNITIFKDIIEQFRLFINNKSGQTTRPSNREVSIINLVLSLLQLDFLTLWEISKKYSLLFNHELMVLR